MQRCVQACSTLDCIEACGGADAGAVGAPLATVLGGVCSTPCAWGSNWTCVGRVSWPKPKAGTIAISADVQDYVTAMPAPGVDVAVCNPADVACSQPLAQGATDATGTVSLQIPIEPSAVVPLTGSLMLTSPNIVPLRFFWGFALSESEVSFGGPRGGSLVVITPSELSSILASVGVSEDPARGIVIALVRDCTSAPATGVQVTTGESDALIRALYGTTGSTAQTSTDATGVVMFVNVPPGNLDLTATPKALGKPSSHATVPVQPGTMTWVEMPPTP